MGDGDGKIGLEIESLKKSLHREGLRMTAPRRRLLAQFIGSPRLVTAQTLYQEVEPEVGEATVYRLLDTLCRLGRARRYALPGGNVAYLYCGGTHHHHAICLACGEVREIDCQPALFNDAADFEVTDHELELFGRCAKCRNGPA